MVPPEGLPPLPGLGSPSLGGRRTSPAVLRGRGGASVGTGTEDQPAPGLAESQEWSTPGLQPPWSPSVLQPGAIDTAGPRHSGQQIHAPRSGCVSRLGIVSLGARLLKKSPAMWETRFNPWSWESPLKG